MSPSTPVVAQPSPCPPRHQPPPCCGLGLGTDGLRGVGPLPALWLHLSWQEDPETPGSLPPSGIGLCSLQGVHGASCMEHTCACRAPLPPEPGSWSSAHGDIASSQPPAPRALSPDRPQAVASPDSTSPPPLCLGGFGLASPRASWGWGWGYRSFVLKPWCVSWRDREPGPHPTGGWQTGLGRGWACPWLPSFLQPKP